ncbi:hypothetical protein GCM10025858_36900 [Alicyclobacillus sacchari]|nr:hypothetical protein GCM10025858_36900 [Alicyclobacillus sacchari]
MALIRAREQSRLDIVIADEGVDDIGVKVDVDIADFLVVIAIHVSCGLVRLLMLIPSRNPAVADKNTAFCCMLLMFIP